MNLKNGQITVGEILQNPRARALLQQEVPQVAGLMNSPLAGLYKNMPLNAALSQAQRFVPASRVQYLLGCLEKL